MSSELLISDSKPRPEGLRKLCEGETVILPRDITPSKCAYFLKQNIVFISYIFIHIIITIILNRLALSAHGNTLIIILAALLITISLFLLLLLPYLNCSRYKLRCLDDDCKFKLLAEVITHKPNVDLSTWDRIAYDMNQFVYDRRICADRSFFYDGSSCYQVFKKLVATPYLVNSNMNSIYTDLEMRSNGATNINDSGNSSLHIELGTYIFKALAVFRNSVDKYWEDKYPEMGVTV
ncbi:XXYS1_4_G0000080.mRNA.1.CDS.1 [Saccharomyces cerevisiae]|nr:XXYS1_4_G0000080.mRNA.1.CDS.1 [Saccharomyces cerevisiae]